MRKIFLNSSDLQATEMAFEPIPEAIFFLEIQFN